MFSYLQLSVKRHIKLLLHKFMYKYFCPNFVLLVLIFSLSTNMLAWAFQGEIFMHELDDYHHVHTVMQISPENNRHEELHAENNSDHLTYICLNAAYQPLLFSKLSSTILVIDQKIPTELIAPLAPESFLESPYRPPRKVTANKISKTV